MTVLVGLRIKLRPYKLGEFDAYLAASKTWFAQDPEEDGRTFGARLKERFDRSGTWTPSGIEFAIEHEGRLVGDIQARTNPAAMPNGVLEVGIELFDASDRGNGLGSEALQVLAGHLFDVREAHRVQLTTDLDNTAMRRAAERVGFAYEGVMRAFMPTPKGPRDYALYAMSIDDYKKNRNKGNPFATMAQQMGLTYSIQDPFGLIGEPFTLFRKGYGQGVENVVWGVWQGINLRAFDFWYYERTSDSSGQPSDTYYRFDCAIVPIDAACMRLTITHQSMLTRLETALSFHDIEFESEDFNRAYDVRSADKKFANDLIDARMMQWLITDGAGYSFEIIDSEVLCYTSKIAPLAFVPMLGTAKGFLEHVPDVVHSLYPMNQR